MSVFFRKVQINESTGSAMIQCTSTPITNKKTTLAGLAVGSRTQGNITFGQLSLIDPETNLVMRANHPTIQELMKKLEPGQDMPGFRMSDNAVTDLRTGELTTLMWVEAV